MELSAEPISTTGIPPDHGVVADRPSRRMIEGGDHRKGLAFAKVQWGDELLDFVGADQPAVHAEHLVELSAHSEPENGGLGMPKVEPSALAEKEVVVELLRKALIQLEALAEEGDALRSQVVGPQYGGAPGAGAPAHVAFVQHATFLIPSLPR